MGIWLAQAVGWVPPVPLLALAWFFGRTLRPGSVPLIERICRRAFPSPSARMCRYTRGLTALWCGYFVACAFVSALLPPTDGAAFGRLGAAIWLGSVLLFVGEWAVRKRVFPDERFPGLVQQLRDTCLEWRPRRAAGSTGGR